MISPDHVTAHFPADGTSARGARRLVAATVEEWGLGDLVEVGSLLVSELVSNVVLHAGTELDVHIRRSGTRVRVEVHDRNPVLPERKFYSATSATGRGLVFVAELASSWGVEPAAGGGGKAVWFELDAVDQPDRSSPVAAGAEFDLDSIDDGWPDLTDLAGPTPSGSGPAAHAQRARAVLCASGPAGWR